MSKFFSLCRANNKKHGLKDRSIDFDKPTNSGKRSRPGSLCYCLSIFLISLIFLVSGFYIFNITSTATHGFKVSEYENKIAELKLANQDLKEKVDNFENLDYIKSKADELGLVSVSEVEYLDVDDIGVALK